MSKQSRASDLAKKAKAMLNTSKPSDALATAAAAICANIRKSKGSSQGRESSRPELPDFLRRGQIAGNKGRFIV